LMGDLTHFYTIAADNFQWDQPLQSAWLGRTTF
jgi:hypothetical protein